MFKLFLYKTLGGLSLSYYLRHFLFGAAICAFFIFIEYSASTKTATHSFSYSMALFFIICTFLYPYSRFVYESIVSFILGNNVFFVNDILMLAVKVLTMFFCWLLSIFIAPIGLAYLYFYHTKNEKNIDTSTNQE